MHGVKRVVIFCLMTAILPTVLIITPLYLRHSIFADVSYPVAESDVVAIMEGISSVFCESQSLRMNTTFSAFQLKKSPALSKKRKHIRLKKSMTLPDDTLEYWGFYLLKGATVYLKVCSRYEGSRILVVRGEKNLNTCGLLEHNFKKFGATMDQDYKQVKVTFEHAQEIDDSRMAGDEGENNAAEDVRDEDAGREIDGDLERGNKKRKNSEGNENDEGNDDLRRNKKNGDFEGFNDFNNVETTTYDDIKNNEDFTENNNDSNHDSKGVNMNDNNNDSREVEINDNNNSKGVNAYNNNNYSRGINSNYNNNYSTGVNANDNSNNLQGVKMKDNNNDLKGAKSNNNNNARGVNANDNNNDLQAVNRPKTNNNNNLNGAKMNQNNDENSEEDNDNKKINDDFFNNPDKKKLVGEEISAEINSLNIEEALNTVRKYLKGVNALTAENVYEENSAAGNEDLQSGNNEAGNVNSIPDDDFRPKSNSEERRHLRRHSKKYLMKMEELHRLQRTLRSDEDIEMRVNRRRNKRDLNQLNQLDGGIEHGGNAINYSRIGSNENSVSSFETDLLTCYDGSILLTAGFNPSDSCTEVRYLELGEHIETVHEIVSDGYYYYIFYSDNDFISNDIHAIFDIYKPTYQYANNTKEKECVNVTECNFPIAFWSDETVIVEIPTQDGIEKEEDNMALLISTCHPRMSVYLFFPIAVIFLILGCSFL